MEKVEELEFFDYLTITIEKRKTKILLDFINKNKIEKNDCSNHLKRVKNCQKDKNLNIIIIFKITDKNKKKKEEIKKDLKIFLEKNKIIDYKLEKIKIPKNIPKKKSDLKNLGIYWPMKLIKNKEIILTKIEKEFYKKKIKELIKKKKEIENKNEKIQNSAFLYNPLKKKIIQFIISEKKTKNPLDHLTIKLINKFSTLLKKFPENYLMNNLEIFIYYEPCLMCSMALVHSRIKRIFYVKKNSVYFGAVNLKFNINDLEINHKYDVFQYVESEEDFLQIL